ncbi:MAG: hypothetical protein U0T83_03175 [Bacteriovoracaceae bacterium]
MKNISVKITSIFLLISNCFALETDQYLMWDFSIKDSTVGVNNYFNYQIEKGVERLNGMKNYQSLSCDKATEVIVKEFLRNNTLTEDQIEIDLKDNNEVELFPNPHNRRELRDLSIYKEFTSFFSKDKIFPVAPNIRVNNIDIGTDKLGHFISLGLNYYYTYRAALNNRNETTNDAFIAAIEYGIFTEKTYYGYLTSGVFSYADLEANFQGLIFILNICGPFNGYIKFNQALGKWVKNAKFDIKPYVNPNWNEVYNPSHYSDKPWKKVSKVLSEKKYCERLYSNKINTFFEELKLRDEMSFSKNYLDHKIASGELNDNQLHSIQNFCANNP